jgi:hypothetical protein
MSWVHPLGHASVIAADANRGDTGEVLLGENGC